MRGVRGLTLMLYTKNDRINHMDKLRKAAEMNPLRNRIKKQAAITRQNKMKKALEDPKKIRAAAQGAIKRQQKLAKAGQIIPPISHSLHTPLLH